MAAEDQVESLLRQAAELPAAAQEELFRSLAVMFAEHLGLREFDDAG
jgi:hypothetical protein